MIHQAVLLALLIAQSEKAAPKLPQVEGTIAGITVGKSSLADVQRRFGSKLILDETEGRHAVRWDGQCEIFFDLEKDNSNQPSNRVMNIQLLNLGKGADPESPCNQIATGRGLKLSDSPDAIQRLYGLPSSKFMRKQLSVARYENTHLCSQSTIHSFNLRNMFIEWSAESMVLQNISVSVERNNCDELRESDAKTTSSLPTVEMLPLPEAEVTARLVKSPVNYVVQGNPTTNTLAHESDHVDSPKSQ